MDRVRGRKIARLVALVIGLALAVHFLRSAGISATLEVMRDAGPWVPVLVLLQAAIVVLEAIGLRSLLVGTARVRDDPMPSWRAWVRGTLVGFTWSVVLPAGRAAGEAIRATVLAEEIGAARAAGAAARQQACSLVGTATACLVCAVVAFFGVGSRTLGLLLLANALVVAFLASAVFLVVTRVGSSGRLHRWLSKIVDSPHDSIAPSRAATVRAALYCTAGRLVQALQCAVAITAIGLHSTVVAAFVTQGVQVLGASAGDLVPGQIGVVEGMYTAFARALGVADAPARALSLSLLLRAANLGLAAIAAVGGILLLGRKQKKSLPHD